MKILSDWKRCEIHFKNRIAICTSYKSHYVVKNGHGHYLFNFQVIKNLDKTCFVGD